MIGLATQVFDLNGGVLLKRTSKSDISDVMRRISRTATLDGGAVITDGGHTVADKTLEIVAEKTTRADFDAVEYLVKNYNSLIVSTEFGCYAGAPERLRLDGTTIKLRVLVTEELA